MKFSRLVTVFIFILFAVQCQGQSSNESFTYGAVILKHTTNEPIAFATVYKSRDLKGTVSNLAGEFWLDNVLPDDTIICSYIGYEKLIIKAQNQRIDTLYFQKKDRSLNRAIPVS